MLKKSSLKDDYFTIDDLTKMKLTQASNSDGESTRLSRTVWVLVTKFNKLVVSVGDGVKSWFRFSKALE